MTQKLAAVLLALGAGHPRAGAQKAADAKTASEYYLQYHKAMSAAKTIDDLRPFMDAAQQKEMDASPKAEQDLGVKMISGTYADINDVKVVKETAKGSVYTLDVTAIHGLRQGCGHGDGRGIQGRQGLACRLRGLEVRRQHDDLEEEDAVTPGRRLACAGVRDSTRSRPRNAYTARTLECGSDRRGRRRADETQTCPLGATAGAAAGPHGAGPAPARRCWPLGCAHGRQPRVRPGAARLHEVPRSTTSSASGRADLLLPLVGAVVAATLVQGVTSFALTQLLSKAAQRLIAELRRKVQAHIGRLPVAYYDANKTGALVSRIMSDVEGVRNLVGTGLVEFVGRAADGRDRAGRAAPHQPRR